MPPETLQDAVISQYENLAKYTRKIQSEFEAKKIHKLRIAFKKLRALLRWQKADKRIFNLYKKIYTLAGSLRNIQVAKTMILREKDIPLEFKYWLSTEFFRLRKEWNNLDYEKQLKQIKSRLQKIELSPKKNVRYFDKKAKKITIGMDSVSISDSAIHGIRKQAKDIQYSVKYWGSNKQNDFLKNNFPVKTLKSITSQIGKYNDHRILIQFLESFARVSGDQTAIKRIIPVIEKLQHHKSLRKLRLLNRIKVLKLSDQNL